MGKRKKRSKPLKPSEPPAKPDITDDDCNNQDDVGSNQLYSVEMVLAQPLLLEKIVNFAMESDRMGLRFTNICSCRLVDRKWNQAVLKVLRDNGEPLYKVKLTLDNSVNDVLQNEEKSCGKLLDKFVQFYTTNHAKDPTPPTIGLSMEPAFWLSENYNSFYSCLRQCGQNLLKMSMLLPANGGTLSGTFSRVSLPALQELRVEFQPYRNQRSARRGDKTGAFTFIQLLLDKSPALQQFQIMCRDPLPPKFEQIRLPRSTTKLTMFTGQTAMERVLLANPLPNLCSLELVNFQDNCGMEPFVRIMEKFRKNLQVLILVSKKIRDLNRNVVLPVMPKLELLMVSLATGFFEFDVNAPSFSVAFPKLKILKVVEQTPTMWSRWTSGPPFGEVTELNLEVGEWQPVTLTIMERACATFQNVQRLALCTTATETDALRLMFQEMGQLTCLNLQAKVDTVIRDANVWDALLTGAESNRIATLRTCPIWRIWEQIDKETPSIRMLNKLKTLHLGTPSLSANDNRNAASSLISDFAFVFALLRMPNLTKLHLEGRFGVSQRMREEWVKRGRKFI